MQVDEMIKSIEVVKGGHVTRLAVSNGERTEQYAFPFDSEPPSLVVVSREGLVKLLAPHPNLPLTFEQLKERVGKPVWRSKPYAGWAILLGVHESWDANTAGATCKVKLSDRPEMYLFTAVPKYYDHELCE